MYRGTKRYFARYTKHALWVESRLTPLIVCRKTVCALVTECYPVSRCALLVCSWRESSSHGDAYSIEAATAQLVQQPHQHCLGPTKKGPNRSATPNCELAIL